MSSITGVGADEVLATLDSAVDDLSGLDALRLTQGERLRLLRQAETIARKMSGALQPVIAALAADHVPGQFGGARVADVMADSLRITPAEARRRIAEARDLTDRRAITGEPLPAVLPLTAAAQRRGLLGREHVAVIRGFWERIPAAIDIRTKARAEAHMAGLATELRPDELRKATGRLLAHWDADGPLNDADRARRRGFTIGSQGPDLMSAGHFCLDPELRACIDALMAKFAAPGMCNPADDAPVVDGEPDSDTVARDTRSSAQRQHDALKAMCRMLLCSNTLGQHRGLPVTTIVTTTLSELQSGRGAALTAGGTVLPMPDVIRMAAHAHHYLAIFDDDGRALHLGRAKRIATADQRIVLTARDRGCTFPGCDRPAYHTEVHHRCDWATGGTTDIDNLGAACAAHHHLAGTGDDEWRAIRGADGRTWWVPPPHIDPAQRPRKNHFHHPADYLRKAVGPTRNDPGGADEG